MDEAVKTIPINVESEKTISVWMGRGQSLTRLPGKFDHVVVVTHAQGTDNNSWNISVPSGISIEPLIPILLESLKRFAEERNISLATKGPDKLVAAKTTTETIPFPKGMTKEQIDEFAQNLNAVNKRIVKVEPPK